MMISSYETGIKNLSEMTILFFEQNLAHFFLFQRETGGEKLIEIIKGFRKTYFGMPFVWMGKRAYLRDWFE